MAFRVDANHLHFSRYFHEWPSIRTLSSLSSTLQSVLSRHFDSAAVREVTYGLYKSCIACHLLVTVPHSLTHKMGAWVLWLLLWIRSVPPIFPPCPYFSQTFPMHMQLEQQKFYDAVQSIVTDWELGFTLYATEIAEVLCFLALSAIFNNCKTS